MKARVLFLLIFSFSAFNTFAQTTKEVELKSSIKEVTVFLQNAQITRTGKASVPQGKSILVVKSLSPHIDDKSVQVKATGDFTILSVNHRFNYLNELKKDSRIDSLDNLLTKVEKKIDEKASRSEVLNEKKSLLNANKDLGGQNSGATLTQLKQAIDFYDRELSSIKKEEMAIAEAVENLRKERTRLQKQINDVRGQKELPSGEIVVRVDAPAKVEGGFTITYLVGNAGWFPKYDVRVKDVESPIKLSYKADVYQNTGVDWKNVKLKFSNGNPNQSGVAPELRTWYLNYARNTVSRAYDSYGAPVSNVRYVTGKVVSASNGSAIPGVNVLVKGTTVGTVTDIDGNYRLTVPNGASSLVFSFIGYNTREMPIKSSRIDLGLQEDVNELSEVVVTGYGMERKNKIRAATMSARERGSDESRVVTTTTIENQTTVEFEVKTPYSIKSNGEKLSVDLSQYDIEAIYQYYAAPKLDKDAFLIARIINWDQYNLLEGEANLYFEDAYVGRSVLDAKSLADTLDISLGRDKSIVIGREKVDEFSKRRTVGANKVETRGFKLLVRNKKSQPIKLILHDQIPVASISDITVTADELSGGKLDEQTGEITWELELKPNEQKDLNLSYEVKYPKREKVILE